MPLPPAGGVGNLRKIKIMVDVEQIKSRVSLRLLLERDNVEVKRLGQSWVACCPIHNETTPSFHLHEGSNGDWFKCFGCDAKGDVVEYWSKTRNCNFKEAIDSLAEIAGLGVGVENFQPLPKRELPPEEVVVIEELDGEDALKWEKACAELCTDSQELGRWAAWRGIREEVIAWAGRKQLCGKVMMYGEWREAFLIRDVVEGVMRDVGFHVRLAPRKEGEKASWRYSNCWTSGIECVPSKGLGAWPFVVLPEGGIEAAKYVFCCEGQWDALALIDVMGWDAKWPEQVAVFGMRGATSWKKMLEYALREDATAFLFSDNDTAGRGWFVGEENFANCLKKRIASVQAFPAKTKDLNDDIKLMGIAQKSCFRDSLRRWVIKPVKTLRPTFLKWLKGEKKKDREQGFIEFAIDATKRGAQVPKGRARKGSWIKFMQAWPEHKEAFLKGWAEWESIDWEKINISQDEKKSKIRKKREPFLIVDDVSVWEIDGMIYWYALVPGAASHKAAKDPTEKQHKKQFDVRNLPSYDVNIGKTLSLEEMKAYHSETIGCAIKNGYRLEAFNKTKTNEI